MKGVGMLVVSLMGCSGEKCHHRQDKTRQCFIWSLIQSYVYRLYLSRSRLVLQAKKI